MVGICEEYAKEYDIVFNCKKTVGIQFVNRCNNSVIKLNGNDQMAKISEASRKYPRPEVVRCGRL